MRCCLLTLAFAIGVPALAADDAGIFAGDAKLKVEAGGGAGGEGPAWHPKLGVLTTAATATSISSTSKASRTVYRKDAGTNGLLFDAQGPAARLRARPTPHHAHRGRTAKSPS